MYVFIQNIAKNGLYDYKGLDIEQFIAGTQKYDFLNNSVAVETTEEIQTAPSDVEIWTKAQYENFMPQLQLSPDQEEIKQLKKDIKILREELTYLQTSVTELFEFVHKK